MVSGLHHFYKRKRTCAKHEKGPPLNKLKRLIDKLIYIAAIFGPLLTIPQVWKIWVEQNAMGVSIITWVAYLIGGIFWLIYGLVHKEKPIILANIIWIAMEITIIIGILIYG